MEQGRFVMNKRNYMEGRFFLIIIKGRLPLSCGEMEIPYGLIETFHPAGSVGVEEGSLAHAFQGPFQTGEGQPQVVLSLHLNPLFPEEHSQGH